MTVVKHHTISVQIHLQGESQEDLNKVIEDYEKRFIKAMPRHRTFVGRRDGREIYVTTISQAEIVR